MKINIMGFSFTKIVSSFKKRKASENVPAADDIASIIKDIENTPFAIAEENIMYAGLNELGGYFFFQTVIVGKLHFKTLNGAQLHLKGEGIDLKLMSDMMELESEHTHVAKRSVTKIDFQMEEMDIEKLKNQAITQLILKAKNNTITFKKQVISDEEE